MLTDIEAREHASLERISDFFDAVKWRHYEKFRLAIAAMKEAGAGDRFDHRTWQKALRTKNSEWRKLTWLTRQLRPMRRRILQLRKLDHGDYGRCSPQPRDCARARRTCE